MILSILIPALNEEKTIAELIQRIPKSFDEIDTIHIIVVNDGSTDNTGKLAEENGAIVITHGRNQGLGKTFWDGLEKSIELKSDIMVTIDADLQFDPNEIKDLIKPIVDKKADFVTGSRFLTNTKIENMPIIKYLGNKFLAKIISWGSSQKIHDVSCGFRAYGKEAILNLNLFGRFTYTQETILDLAYKNLTLTEVPITVKYFKERKSRIASSILNYGYRSGLLILRTIKDYHPLRFFGFCGIIIFLIGTVLDFFVFNHFFKTGSFSPYKIYGFLGAFLNAVGFMIGFLGILADLIDKIRITQEKILYISKKKYYD